MKHVLALDQGTTGSTCLVFNESGRIVGRGYREITQHYPAPGRVEHDAAEILRRTVDAAREAIAQAGVVPDAIGITNQRETIVVWDRDTGEPVAPAIVWQDRRTTARCIELAGRESEISSLTGLVVDPYFSATKLEWLLRNDEKVVRLAASGRILAGTIDCWLIWKLTGGAVHATDYSNASRTMLFDIDRREWSAALLDLFAVPRELLPEVRASAGDFGECMPEYFGKAIPICGVAGDQQAALYGQGCWASGTSKNTYGTGAFLLFNVGEKRPAGSGDRRDGLLTTLACSADGSAIYALEASIFIAGAAIQWLRDGLRIIDSASESEALARSVESTDGVSFVPALVGLGAPHWEPNARGTIVGISRGTGRAHLVRAALESMAYGTRDVLDVMRARVSTAGSASRTESLRVDGGAAANDWLMQFQADVLGIAIERPGSVETTALGAAGLAGVASRVWTRPEQFLDTIGFSRFEPRTDHNRSIALEGYAAWHSAVSAALAWAKEQQPPL